MNAERRTNDRIAATRTARRLTQRQLAESAHISLSLIRKIEQGRRPASDQALEAIASALGVQPDALTGRRLDTDSRVHAAIPSLRTVIDAYDLPEDGLIRPLDQLRKAADEATRLRLASQYTRLVETLPPLLAELTRAAHGAHGFQLQATAGLLAVAYRAADAVAYKYGYYDLSARLVELMRRASDMADDPALRATAAYVRTEVFFASCNLTPAMRALESAIDEIPQQGTPVTRAAAGSLHMRAAVVAARSTDDPAAVDEHLAHAQRLAASVPEGIYNGTAFGPASLRVHEIAVAVELGDASRALNVAESSVDETDRTTLAGLPAERSSHYLIDLARARLWLGLRDEAFQSLQAARKIAPQHVREHPHVRDALVTLLRLHFAPPHALVTFAEWAHAI
ncbi:helix-turn-helix domain-containing protein [Actinomadura xylanilytica]|uniref:helix-turn-helix domain-containing protein n=1 Tax=Actinomadura xylanilytica TaxID=887459 RepID=UPI00255ADC68|nr:helix-turn-helix transcriptional regulator [Actinomadura xylanilytica]MDL4776087.1 helix-turn-helix transcriptional regulator [Actinomadura xylanilytica]